MSSQVSLGAKPPEGPSRFATPIARSVDPLRAHIKVEGGTGIRHVRTDVSKESDVAALVKHAVETFGALDCAFNNAGIAATPVLLHETPEALFDREIAVDLKGVFHRWVTRTYSVGHFASASGTIDNERYVTPFSVSNP